MADRLVTKRGKEHDRFADKTILFCATNCILSIGYTGLAYVGEKPTDQWIVEQLTRVIDDRPMAIRSGSFDHVDVGRALARIHDAFERYPAQLPHAWRKYWADAAVFTGGWQWTSRGHSRPILASITNNPSDTSCQLEYAERHWYVGKGEQVRLWGGPLENAPGEDRTQLRNRLAEVKTRDDVEQALVHFIRNVANRNRLVGQNCMSILLSPPRFGIARVRYMPRIAPDDDDLSDVASVAYTPWIVGENLILALSLIRGKRWTIQLGVTPSR